MILRIYPLATFLTLTACSLSHQIGGSAPAPDDAGIFDAGGRADAVADVEEPERVIPGCARNLRLEGREASVPVDVIWVVRGGSPERPFSNLLGAFRGATDHYWSAIQSGDVDTMNVLIIENEDVLPGPPGGFAGRMRYILDANADPGFALTESYEYYESALRPDSRRHVVVITDGVTRLTPPNLQRTLQAQLGEDYTMHAIVSEQLAPSVDNPLGVCFSDMGSAENADVIFSAIAEETGGTVNSICSEDWDGLIRRLSETIAIRVPIPCAFTLPIVRPPGVRQYNERDIRLSATAGDVTELLRNVEDRTQCYAGDWWLFPGSDRVHLCPEACEEIERTRAVLDVELACGI